MKLFAKIIWNICGWTFIGDLDPSIKKYVMIMAPHTSSLDFLWGRLGLWMKGFKIHFLIKKEFFVFPIGFLLKKMGGVPVDRANSRNGVVSQIVKKMKEHDQFGIMITPEGTRKYTTHWKKGYYKIAMEAQVPIIISSLDYAKKEGKIIRIFYPTGDYEKDFQWIQSLYMDITAKHPEKFNLSPQYRKNSSSL